MYVKQATRGLGVLNTLGSLGSPELIPASDYIKLVCEKNDSPDVCMKLSDVTCSDCTQLT